MPGLEQKKWLSEIKKLPVLPQVAMKIAERIQSPTATLGEISSLIETDAGITARVLKLANSSYYSVPGGVSDVPKALQYLGFTTIAQLVLTTSVFGAFKSSGTKEFNLTQFWKHSFGVGLAAEITARLLQNTGKPTSLSSKDAFVAGIMHDLGKLIWLETSPDQLNQIVLTARENNFEFIDAEKSLGLPTHIELAQALAEHWNLPKAVKDHLDHHSRAHIITWANYWIHTQEIGHSGSFSNRFAELEVNASNELKIPEHLYSQIKTLFETEFKRAEAILSGHR